MPILTTDQYGIGPLFTFGVSDPNALLKDGVDYYQTSTGQTAILMSLGTRMRLTIEGSIFSNGSGIGITNTGTAKIVVTDAGYVGGESAAIFSTGAALDITNSGTIQASAGSAISVATTVAAQTATRVYNSGTIRTNSSFREAILLGGGDDEVVNTGSIVGALFMGNGNNYVDTHLGDITGSLVGGNGNNIFIIKGTESVRGNSGYDVVRSYGDYALRAGVEELELFGAARVGTGNADGNVLLGNQRDNVLNGRDGDDVIDGQGGEDLLLGGRGNDLLALQAGNGVARGGVGNDTLFANGDGAKALYGDAGDDLITLTDGDNSVFGGGGNDFIRSGPGADLLSGDADFDTVSYSSETVAITVNLTTGIGIGGRAEGDRYVGIERILGGLGNDTLIGSASADTLDGGSGIDLVQGLGGQDILFVGLGDTMDGGTGFDTAVFTGDVRMTVNLTTGVAAFETLGTATLILIENVEGGLGGDTITGSSAINILKGSNGNDTLDAGRGNDTLVGGTGNDTLTGGLNNDVFLFGEVAHGQDIVTDFDAGDTISFFGNSSVAAFGALTISQSDADTLIVTPGGEILLQNYTATGLTADRFIFADGSRGIPEPAGAAYPDEFAI